MAKKIVDEIRQAECQAQEIISEAEAAAKKTLEQANLTAQEIKAAEVGKAKAQSDGIIAAAGDDSKAMADSARVEAQRIGDELRQTAAANTESAVNKVIELLKN